MTSARWNRTAALLVLLTVAGSAGLFALHSTVLTSHSAGFRGRHDVRHTLGKVPDAAKKAYKGRLGDISTYVKGKRVVNKEDDVATEEERRKLGSIAPDLHQAGEDGHHHFDAAAHRGKHKTNHGAHKKGHKGVHGKGKKGHNHAEEEGHHAPGDTPPEDETQAPKNPNTDGHVSAMNGEGAGADDKIVLGPGIPPELHVRMEGNGLISIDGHSAFDLPKDFVVMRWPQRTTASTPQHQTGNADDNAHAKTTDGGDHPSPGKKKAPSLPDGIVRRSFTFAPKAYVLVISNNAFVDGALVMAHSLRKHSPMIRRREADLVLIATAGRLSEQNLARLVGNRRKSPNARDSWMPPFEQDIDVNELRNDANNDGDDDHGDGTTPTGKKNKKKKSAHGDKAEEEKGNEHEVHDNFPELPIFDTIVTVPSLAPRAPNAAMKDTFDKAYMFSLTIYEKIVFMDADMINVKSSDNLFVKKYGKDETELGAIGFRGRHGEADYFQTGMMVILPSKRMFGEIMEEFDANVPPRGRRYNIGMNGRDGVLLRSVFKSRFHEIDNKYSRNLDPRKQVDKTLVSIHLRGKHKPWFDWHSEVEDPTMGKKEFGFPYLLWWVLNEEIHYRSKDYRQALWVTLTAFNISPKLSPLFCATARDKTRALVSDLEAIVGSQKNAGGLDAGGADGAGKEQSTGAVKIRGAAEVLSPLERRLQRLKESLDDGLSEEILFLLNVRRKTAAELSAVYDAAMMLLKTGGSHHDEGATHGGDTAQDADRNDDKPKHANHKYAVNSHWRPIAFGLQPWGSSTPTGEEKPKAHKRPGGGSPFREQRMDLYAAVEKKTGGADVGGGGKEWFIAHGLDTSVELRDDALRHLETSHTHGKQHPKKRNVHAENNNDENIDDGARGEDGVGEKEKHAFVPTAALVQQKATVQMRLSHLKKLSAVRRSKSGKDSKHSHKKKGHKHEVTDHSSTNVAVSVTPLTHVWMLRFSDKEYVQPLSVLDAATRDVRGLVRSHPTAPNDTPRDEAAPHAPAVVPDNVDNHVGIDADGKDDPEKNHADEAAAAVTDGHSTSPLFIVQGDAGESCDTVCHHGAAKSAVAASHAHPSDHHTPTGFFFDQTTAVEDAGIAKITKVKNDEDGGPSKGDTVKMKCAAEGFLASSLQSCTVLRHFFPHCECELTVYWKQHMGKEYPGLGVERDVCRWNLMRDVRSASTCDAAHPDTKRLCPCVMA